MSCTSSSPPRVYFGSAETVELRLRASDVNLTLSEAKGKELLFTVDRAVDVIPSAARDLQFDGHWRCDVHAAAHRVHTARIATERAAEAEASRHQSVLRGARVVDLYHTNGTRDRLIYRAEEHLRDGDVCAIVLRCGTREIAIRISCSVVPSSKYVSPHSLHTPAGAALMTTVVAPRSHVAVVVPGTTSALMSSYMASGARS